MSTAAERQRRRGTLWAEVKALAVPLTTYWGAVCVSLGLFMLVIAITEGMDPTGVWIFAAIWGMTIGGIGIGQAMALARMRLWLAVVTGSLIEGALVGGVYVATATGLGEFVIGPLALAAFLFPFFAVCGLWSLRVHMGLLATWVPIMYLTACIIVIAEHSGRVSRWFAGDKWAIWDVFTAPILLLGVLLLLVYLASRELHRLHRWKFSPKGPDLPMTVKKKGKLLGTAGAGCGGMAVVVVLGLVLTVASAIVAPYLWRTGPGDRDGDSQQTDHQQQNQTDASKPQPQPQPEPEPQSEGCNEQQQQQDPQQGDGDGGQSQSQQQKAQEQVKETVKQTVISIITLVLLLILALLALVVFGPPFRRTLLLQHLRRPLWPVPPTRSILLSWRTVEIALGDMGVYRKPGDTATSLAERAIRLLPPDIDSDAIAECASILDRVLYGLGLEPDDTMRARRSAQMAYQSVQDYLTELQKIRAVYRLL